MTKFFIKSERFRKIIITFNTSKTVNNLVYTLFLLMVHGHAFLKLAASLYLYHIVT